MDNSLAKTASEPGRLPWESRKPRDFPTAHPFAHKLHSSNNIFIFFSKQNIQGLGRGWGCDGDGTETRGHGRQLMPLYPIPLPASNRKRRMRPSPMKGEEKSSQPPA